MKNIINILRQNALQELKHISTNLYYWNMFALLITAHTFKASIQLEYNFASLHHTELQANQLEINIISSFELSLYQKNFHFFPNYILLDYSEIILRVTIPFELLLVQWSCSIEMIASISTDTNNEKTISRVLMVFRPFTQINP